VHPPTSFGLVGHVVVDFRPLDRQRRQDGQQNAQVETSFPCDPWQVFKDFIPNCCRTDHTWRGAMNQNVSGATADCGRQEDVRVSDEYVGQL
jgi:hypothetical protein